MGGPRYRPSGCLSGELTVRLRPVEDADLPLLLRLRNDPEHSAPFLDFGLRTMVSLQRRQAEDGHVGDDGGTLMVADAADGTVYGDVGWYAVHHGPPPQSRCWGIGVQLLAGHRGKGIGGVAQRLLAEHLLATTPCVRLEASTDIDNVAEQRALERAGFAREGVLRRAQWRGGAWHDLVLFSRVRDA